MNLRDVIELTPLLIRHWRPARSSLLAGGMRIDSLLYMLLKSWETSLGKLCQAETTASETHLALAAEIVCCELLTVAISALILSNEEIDLEGKLAANIRSQAAEHAILRNRVLESAESATKNIAQLLRLQRLRRRISRWIDLVLEPVLETVSTSDSKGTFSHVAELQGAVRARQQLMMAGLHKAIPQQKIQDPLRAALLNDLISETMSLCKLGARVTHT